jgi:hypothetical protein
MKFSRNQIIIAALIIVLIAGIGIYFFTRNNSSTTINNPATNQSTVSTPTTPLAKVEPPLAVDFTSYKVATLKDGRQLLLISKELTTREPFATAIRVNPDGRRILPEKVYFIYNTENGKTDFLGGNLNNFSLLNINKTEYWVYSLINNDGTAEVFFSLTDFKGQKKIVEIPPFRIIRMDQIGSLIKVTVNTAQRGEKLEVYNIDFSNVDLSRINPGSNFDNIQPIVTLQK